MDTLSNEAGMKWEINRGTPLILTFAGMAARLYEFEHYEFVRTTKHVNCSKIYCLDQKYIYYQEGISDEVNSLPKMTGRLRELVNEAEPSNIRCLGVSAGGFASLLFGHLLEVDVVHAFGPQTFLTTELENRYYESGMEDYDTLGSKRLLLDEAMRRNPDQCIFDLAPVLKEWNGKTHHVVHVGRGSKKDVAYAKHIAGCPGVEVRYYACNTHACASQTLKYQGRLSQVVLEGI